jgi:hypothetical protein
MTGHDIGMLTPNSVTGLQCFSDQSPEAGVFSQRQSEDLQNGRAYVAVYGQGKYDDIFGKNHWIRFCAWHGYYAGTGNYSARTCTDYKDSGDGVPPK